MKSRIFLLVLLLAFCVSANQLQADEVTRYTFDDGTANDFFGQADGTLLGDAEVIDDPTGAGRGKVLSLDGTEPHDYVDIPMIANTLSECTVSMWIYTTVDISAVNACGGYQCDIWGGGTTGDGNVSLRVTNGVPELTVVRSLDTTSGGNQNKLPATGISVAPNTWYHLAATFKRNTASTGANIYVDGVLKNSQTTRDKPAHITDITSNGGTIGGYDSSGSGNYAIGREWTGYKDEIRFFDHALSQAEITALLVTPAPPDPYVSAGPDKVITLPTNTAALAAEASDNGDPNGILQYTWSEISKPAGSTISLDTGYGPHTISIPGDVDPNDLYSITPTATVDLAGIYTLMLSVDDDPLSPGDANDIVKITVYPTGYLGLVAHWKLDDGSGSVAVDDPAGNFYDPNDAIQGFDLLDTPGQLIGDPNWTEGPDYLNTPDLLSDPDDFGGALALDDGYQEHIAIHNLYYESDENEELTVAAWINTELGSDQIIASFDRGEYWRLSINSDDAGVGQVGFGITTSSGTVGLGSSRTVNDGQWHHVAAVFDNGDISLYIDGIVDDSDTGGATFGSGTLRYGFIGVGSEAEEFNGDKAPETYFKGAIDDVRIYNIALTQQELLDIASLENTPPVADAGPDLRLVQETDGNSIALGDATVIDVPGNVDNVWTATGPGSVIFTYTGTGSDPNAIATFDGSSFGLYQLTLTSTDQAVGTWVSEDTMFIMYQEKAQYSTSRTTPMAHWLLNEASGIVAADSSGNGLDGTLKVDDEETDPNLPLFTAEGRIGGALAFVNANGDFGQYVDLSAVPGSDSMTAMFWMKANTRANMVPLDTYPTGNSGGGWNVKLRGDGRIWFQVGSVGDNDSVRPAIGEASYDPNVWVHLAFTYDKETNTLGEYVNGLSVANKASGNTSISANNIAVPLQMAVPSEATVTEQFQGLLDHVRVYDIALTPVEIALQAIADEVTIEDGCQIDAIEGQAITQDITGPDGVPDCYVDLFDLAEIAGAWLECTDLNNAACW